MVSSQLAAILVAAVSAQDLFLQPSNATLAAAATGKAGIAAHLQNGAAETHVVAGSRMSWNYNWDMNGASESGLDFYPQIHNAGSMSSLGQLPNSEVLLAFNEPNFDPDRMDGGQAAGYWPQIEQAAQQHGVSTIVGPGVANVNPDAWYDDFFNHCSSCRVDAIAIHAYSCDLGNMKNLVDKMKKYNKPLWLTEFACADNPTAIAGNSGGSKAWNWQCKYMQSVIPYLQSESSIAKYSWFSFDTDYTGQSNLVSGSALTELGECYNNLIGSPSPSPPTPPTPPPSASCDAHPSCSGLQGDCCPTVDGMMLGCCGSPSPSPTPPPPPPPAASCASHPACRNAGLAGDCCPTSDGVTLGCCSSYIEVMGA